LEFLLIIDLRQGAIKTPKEGKQTYRHTVKVHVEGRIGQDSDSCMRRRREWRGIMERSRVGGNIK